MSSPHATGFMVLHSNQLEGLRELAVQNDASIREHIRAMEEMRLKDAQAEHHETQETIRAGDKAEDRFVRWTRPAQSWVSLLAALAYALMSKSPSLELVALLQVWQPKENYVFDHESAFRESVVERFADDYLAGRTPIPCIRCNMGPKFTDLLRMAPLPLLPRRK